MKMILATITVIAIVVATYFAFWYRSKNEARGKLYLTLTVLRLPQDVKGRYYELARMAMDEGADCFWASKLARMPLDKLTETIDEQHRMGEREFKEYLRGLKAFSSMTRVLLRSFLPTRKRRREILTEPTS